MAWFRWYEEATSDPKLMVVSRRTGHPVAFVVAVWAMLLERANSASARGWITGFDCESADALLGMPDGAAESIIDALRAKGLLDGEDGDHVAKWEERQPKRERSEEPSSTKRVRDFRERQRALQGEMERGETPCNGDKTQCNATKHHETPRREEKRREEKSVCLNACARVEHPEPEPAHEPVPAPRQPSIGFDQFFDAYPEAHRGGQRDAEKAWVALQAHGALPGLPRLLDALGEWEASPEWAAQGGRFVPTAANFLEREYWQRKPRSPDACTAGTPRQGQPRAMTVAQKNSQDRDMMAKMLLAKKEAKNGCEHELLAGNLGESFAALPAGGQNPG